MPIRKLLFLFTLSVIAISCNQEKSNLTVTGNIKHLKKGTLFLKGIQDTILINLDSIELKGQSNFEFNYELKSPQMLYLSLEDKELPFFAEPGKIQIETSLNRFKRDAQIKGSENQDLLDEFNKTNERFKDENLKLIKAKLMAQVNKNADSVELVNLKLNQLLKKRYLYSVNFAVHHNNKEVAPYIALTQLQDAHFKLLDTINKSLVLDVKNSLYGKSLNQFVSSLIPAENQK